MIEPCDLCGKLPTHCNCSVCCVCGMVGDIYCLDNHYAPQYLYDEYIMSNIIFHNIPRTNPLFAPVSLEYHKAIINWDDWMSSVPKATHNSN